jgi:hypothetical protein
MTTARCSVYLFTLVAASAATATALFGARQSPPPVAAKAMSGIPVPIGFSVTPIQFIADGKEHGPRITPTVAGATFMTAGTVSASQPGDYTFTATATGAFVGSSTCKWRIVPAPGVIAHGRAAVEVRLLLEGKTVAAGTVSDDAKNLRLESPDRRFVATATLSRSIARDAQGRALNVKGDPQWKCYGLLKPAAAAGGQSVGCVLKDGTPTADTSVRTDLGTYTLSLTAGAAN